MEISSEMDIEESKKQLRNDSEFVTTWDFPSKLASSLKQKGKIIFEEYLLSVKLFARWFVSKSQFCLILLMRKFGLWSNKYTGQVSKLQSDGYTHPVL